MIRNKEKKGVCIKIEKQTPKRRTMVLAHDPSHAHACDTKHLLPLSSAVD
jgi:hypothetical protein